MQACTIRIWRQVHTWSSLVCTAFLLVLCVTALPLIFRSEVEGWLRPEQPFPTVAASAPRPGLDPIVAAARRAYPGQFIRSVVFDDHTPQVFVMLAANREGPLRHAHRISFDLRTGALRQDLSRAPHGPDPMAFVLRLHASLLAGPVGQLFMGLVGLLFLAALLSGAVLYAPFMRKLSYGTVRGGGSGRLAWLDLHNLVGVTALVWTLVVGASGIMNSLSASLFGLWQATEVTRVLRRYEPAASVEPVASLQGAVDAARAAVPGETLKSITLPARFQSSPVYYVVWLKGKRTLTSRLDTPVLVDARSGRVAKVVAMPWYLRAVEVSRPLHFGDYGGPVLKVLWALLDLLTIGVLVSGLYLWWAKRRPSAARAALLQAEAVASRAAA